MGTDKNTIIGFVLLALLFFGYFYYTRQSQLAYEKSQQHITDSLNRLKPHVDSLAAKTGTIDTTATSVKIASGGLLQDTTGKEQSFVLENELIKATFSNKGGQPKTVELKKYKAFDGGPLLLQDGRFNKLSYAIKIGSNQTAQTGDLLFTSSNVQKSQNGDQSISFLLKGVNGESVEHKYSLPANQYMLDLDINLVAADKLFTDNTLNLLWQSQAQKQEKDLNYERLQSQVDYVTDGDFDFTALGTGSDKKFEKPIDWVSLKQQFFATSLVAKNKFQSGEVQWTVPADTTTHIIAQATANFKIKVPQTGALTSIPLQFYYGPSDYKILKSYANQMHNIVPLGSGIFAFVKYINRGFVMPVFDFLAKHIVSYGLIIALLTIIIRLLISPLTYQSYLSGAKMKLLKPEIDALKEKYGDDKQNFGLEQMRLFKSAGVNPLGGCIPALLQIPIFFALYNFFNSNILLRGQQFLWSKDLSGYDSIYNLPFHIPFYGAHVSLFTILAVITSLLISLYGMSNMQDNSNPMMKYMPFIFPVILLGVFNNLPSALTWYYTVSNVITLLIQFVIQKYIIDHQKILAQLQANKLKPPSKSKWQERIEAMQETNKNVQRLKDKTTKGQK